MMRRKLTSLVTRLTVRYGRVPARPGTNGRPGFPQTYCCRVIGYYGPLKTWVSYTDLDALKADVAVWLKSHYPQSKLNVFE